jgi:glycosyltransferase involved in cell wall biosynthesis
VMFIGQSLEFYRKGMDLLVAALNELPEAVGLVSVGGGNLTSKLAHRHFPIGRIDDAERLSLAYSAADVFVCPTREDNLPNVVLEAMACGIPVVGFEVGGLPDMVRHGMTGLLAPPEDVGALARSLQSLLSDDTLRNRIGGECRKVAVSEYRMELQAERYQRLYEELIAAARN